VSKTVWSFVNEERCRRDKHTVANISLHQNGNVVSQPQVICDIFNSTFLGNIDKLVSQKDSENAACQNVTNKITDSLYLSEITEEDLLKIIQNMKNKKSTGVDGISSYVLKKCAPYMIRPLLEIINTTIINSIFPSCLKKSVVKPISKKGQHMM
jgi:hypothetical protein